LLFDLAGAVAYAGGVDHAAELVDGYASAGPVTREEIDSALPVLLRFRWAVVADWHARALAAGVADAGALEAARAELARFE
jgi:homoserine kinase type II